MHLDYNLLNILVLFGAIQGFILCILIYPKLKINKKGALFFLLFLFSLAFHNLMYALLDMDVFRYYRPLHVFPFPYKWLIGPAFYFYVKYQFESPSSKSWFKRQWYLFLPAGLYLIVRLYWFGVAAWENSYRITGAVVDSGYFRIQEFFVLFFNLFLLWECKRFLTKRELHSSYKSNDKRAVRVWLNRITYFSLFITIASLLLFSIDLIIHGGKETFAFIYPQLLLNALFIYWVGFMGFTQSQHFFNKIETRPLTKKENPLLAHKLQTALNGEVYCDPNITLNSLSVQLQVSPKELSRYINATYDTNFSEFLNHFRVEKVKALLTQEEHKKYTLLSLAETAGFKSKSTFYAAFKKATGLTPSAFQKEHRPTQN